jgi:hypothetical protein
MEEDDVCAGHKVKELIVGNPKELLGQQSRPHLSTNLIELLY